MPHLRLPVQDHGPLRSTFEGDPALAKTITLAVALFSVLLTGVSLIVRGLL
jgi:hypothetical protein